MIKRANLREQTQQEATQKGIGGEMEMKMEIRMGKESWEGRKDRKGIWVVSSAFLFLDFR